MYGKYGAQAARKLSIKIKKLSYVAAHIYSM